jgi:hypothetical protein
VLLARRSSTPPPPLLLSIPAARAAMGWAPLHVLGEPSIGGSEGGVNRPEEREWRSGEERGDTLHGW